MSTQTALSVIERASVALGSSALEIHLTDLVKKYADIVTIANKDGREQVHAAAMVLRKQRTAIAAAGKGARDDAAKQAEELAERLKREANAPQAGEIVTLIADHYRISNGAALDWLRVMFGDVRVAA